MFNNIKNKIADHLYTFGEGDTKLIVLMMFMYVASAVIICLIVMSWILQSPWTFIIFSIVIFVTHRIAKKIIIRGKRNDGT